MKRYLFAIVAIVAVPAAAGAQSFGGDDPQLYPPNVFIVFDTSGSMRWGLYPGFLSPVTDPRSRAQSAIEVLTGSYLTNLSCSGGQKRNGILDIYGDKLRFGFGSFDDDADSCGRNDHGRNRCYDYGDDTHSRYRLGLKGRYQPGCNKDYWGIDMFGNLIDVVDPNDPDNIKGNTDKIQNEICNLRFPYCTPLGASLYDAHYYYDHYQDEIDYHDPFADCRQNFVILFTDGQENLGSNNYDDLNASCPDGIIPCGAVAQAKELCDDGIPVFVVGFGDASLKPNLDRIAHWGTNPNCSPEQLDAFIADNPALVFAAFQAIMEAILSGAKSRTEIASAPSLSDFEKSYGYVASFGLSLGAGWKGSLKRFELVDSDNDGVPELPDLTANPPPLGVIDFADVLASMTASSRRILTVPYDPRSLQSWSDISDYSTKMPRPVDDSNWQTGLYPLDSSRPETNSAMCIQDVSEAICTSSQLTTICTASDHPCNCETGRQCGPSCSAGYFCFNGFCAECADWDGDGSWCEYMWWPPVYEGTCANEETFAECQNWATPDENTMANYIKDYVRGVPGTTAAGGSSPRSGPELGDIFHSNPQVVPPPSALAPNYKFEVYHVKYKDRPTMVYVGANDGMLHAFVGENSSKTSYTIGQELWGFVPNNLLPKLQRMRHGHEFFVDGTPVIRDVYLPDIQVRDADGNPMYDGAGKPVLGEYRTILVSGERGGGDAYFALDVTDPENPRYLWEYRTGQPPTIDYSSSQCDEPVLQTWARPIIGNVKLKNAHAGENHPLTGEPEPEYIVRPVVIVPGGYLPPQSLSNVTSCVQFAQQIAAAASLHVIDLETGKLLRKFQFSSSLDPDSLDCLKDYEDQLLNNPNAPYSCTFKSADWSGGNGWGWGHNSEVNESGWFCREDRDHTQDPPEIPPDLAGNCRVTEDDTKYEKICCLKNDHGSWTTASPDSCNFNSVGWCHYSYTYFKTNNSVRVQFKGDSCSNGKFSLRVGENFNVETVAATPVAYNTALGELITRVFIPSTVGKIWRVDMTNAEYDYEKPEGEMVYEFEVDGNKYDWSVPMEKVGDEELPVPWFDAFDPTNYPGAVSGPRRPITVEPALAMNYKRNLVLFFGTGRVDNLTWTDTTDYFFGVEETRSEDSTTHFIVPDKKGKIFCDSTYGPSCSGSGIPKAFATSERLFGKPIVVAGGVYFTTYQPSTDVCEEGTARVYGYRFNDFNHELIPSANQTLAEKGTPTLGMIYTSKGPAAIIQTNTKLAKLPTEKELIIGAKVMHWGRVL